MNARRSRPLAPPKVTSLRGIAVPHPSQSAHASAHQGEDGSMLLVIIVIAISAALIGFVAGAAFMGLAS